MMITATQIVKYNNHFILLRATPEIERELTQKEIQSVELRIDDGRSISAEQRKKIFAIIRDIALWSGHEPEYLRAYMTWDFCYKTDRDYFSLSDVDMTTAKEFINYLITFCFCYDVPTKDTLLNQTDDIGKYLYLCLEHRKCAVCNRPAEVHHVDRIGIGGDREKTVHVGLKAIALCREHHEEAHKREKEFFAENYIYGIKLDKYLCDKLNLNTRKRK